MSSRSRDLLSEALTLPSDQRARLAAELLASLDEPEADPAAIEAEWAAEIERRAVRALAGNSPTLEWAEARRRADDELTRR